MTFADPGLYANIHAKQERTARNSKEHIRKPSDPSTPSIKHFVKTKETAKSKRITK